MDAYINASLSPFVQGYLTRLEHQTTVPFCHSSYLSIFFPYSLLVIFIFIIIIICSRRIEKKSRIVLNPKMAALSPLQICVKML